MWKVVWARTTESTGPVYAARKSQPLGLGWESVPSYGVEYSRRIETRSRLGLGVGNHDRPAFSWDRVSEII